MAIYHLTAKVIGRASGRSSVAAAAYRSAERLRDERQGIEHDYSRKGGVVHTEILAPDNAPDWMLDRDLLWNAVEAAERRKDAQLAREIEVALPRELAREERLELLCGFVQREFTDRGMIADLAVHEGTARDGQDQPHAHVMLTMRELTGGGFGKKDRSWNEPDLLVGWREAWARDANAALERAGRPERIDHRTLEAQREEVMQRAEQARETGKDELALVHDREAVEFDREPEPKIGAAANALEKQGIRTERGDEFRAAQERNEQRRELGRRQLELTLELIERGREAIAAARERLADLWHRAEAAMSKMRERFIGAAERKAPGDDLEARRAQVLGRASPERQRQGPGSSRERDAAADDPDRERREAILGRHRDGSRERPPERDRDRGR